MISVPLSKRGNTQWYTQEFDSAIEKPEPMIIPGCSRCLGIFIFWKSKEHHNMHAITGAHIVPSYGKSLRIVHQELRRQILQDIPAYVPYLIVVGGGKLNTEQNRILYASSVKKFVLPFKYLFPNVQVQPLRFNLTHNKSATLFLDKHGNPGILFKRVPKKIAS